MSWTPLWHNGFGSSLGCQFEPHRMTDESNNEQKKSKKEGRIRRTNLLNINEEGDIEKMKPSSNHLYAIICRLIYTGKNTLRNFSVPQSL